MCNLKSKELNKQIITYRCNIIVGMNLNYDKRANVQQTPIKRAIYIK